MFQKPNLRPRWFKSPDLNPVSRRLRRPKIILTVVRRRRDIDFQSETENIDDIIKTKPKPLPPPSPSAPLHSYDKASSPKGRNSLPWSEYSA